MGLIPLHLEHWVLSHCSIYSDVRHIDLPAPQLTASYRMHSDYNETDAPSATPCPKQKDVSHCPGVSLCYRVQRPFLGYSKSASHPTPFCISLLYLTLELWEGAVCLLPFPTHRFAHERKWLWAPSLHHPVLHFLFLQQCLLHRRCLLNGLGEWTYSWCLLLEPARASLECQWSKSYIHY